MKSLLRLFSIAALFVILSASVGVSQSLYFCEGVDDDGYPEGESSSFTIGRNGSYLYVLVRLDYPCMSKEVYFYIYKVDSRGKETYDNTITMDTDEDWTWFWQKITFYDAGIYNVYVYDDLDYSLAKGQVRISYR